jgi:cytoskeletal protein RodZ
MKQCPACDFNFPDFHRVCDFDGTELIPDPSRPTLPNKSRHPRFLRRLRSPVLWAGFLLLFVLSTAFLTAYLDATYQSTDVAEAQPLPAAVDSAIAGISDRSSTKSETQKSVKPSILSKSSERSSVTRSRQVARRRVEPHLTHTVSSKPFPLIAPTTVARLESTPSFESQPPTTVARLETAPTTAPPLASKREAPDKGNKVTGMLKTTWRVIKKPFRF